MIHPFLRLIAGVLGGLLGIGTCVMVVITPFPEKLVCLGMACVIYIFLYVALTGEDAPIGGSDDLLDIKDYLERTFQISLSYEELVDMQTPQHLIHRIMTTTTISDQTSCMSQHAFYLIRRMLIEEFHIPRAMITPHTELERLIPQKQRQAFWTRCHALAGSHVSFPWGLPPLHVPTWLERPVWYSSIIGTIIGILTLLILFVSEEYTLMFLIALCMGGIITVVFPIVQSYQYVFPEGYHRIVDLIYHILATHPERFRTNSHAWNASEIRTIIKALFLDISHRDDYHEHWNIFEDFGIDI